jgi:hypothetical protein
MSAALAAEGHFQPVLPDFPSFSAASKAQHLLAELAARLKSCPDDSCYGLSRLFRLLQNQKIICFQYPLLPRAFKTGLNPQAVKGRHSITGQTPSTDALDLSDLLRISAESHSQFLNQLFT